MEEKESRRQQTNNKQTTNWWKWSFIALVTLIAVFFVWLLLLIRPVSVHEPNDTSIEQSESEMKVEASLNKEDATQFINTYLKKVNTEEDNQYTVELTDQLKIKGEVDIFNFGVPFTLSFDPYVMENGNIQLRADSLELASFSMPISSVISLFAEQLEVPEFIAIDSESQMIVINLNDLRETTNIGVEMTKIDLENDEIKMNLYIDEAEIIDDLPSTIN